MSGLVAYPGQQVEIEAFVETLGSKLAAPALASATTITVYDASRWSTGTLKIGDGDPQNGPARLATISSITGNVVTLTAALGSAWGVGTPVWLLAAGTIACGVQVEPAGTPASVTLSSVTTGRYRGTHTLVDADTGENSVEVNSTGATVAAGATTFTVRSPIA